MNEAQAAKEKWSAVKWKAYGIPSLPLDWVVYYESQWWVVPSAHRGWERRQVYKGVRPSEKDRVKPYLLLGLGMPRSGTKSPRKDKYGVTE